MSRKINLVFVLSTLFFFGAAMYLESTAWARAGGGRSMGSRGSRSFSTPSTPSPSSPGINSPGRGSFPGSQSQPGGFFGRSPFMQGLAGGLAGGMLGSLLFGGMGHASAGGAGGGGIGLMDIALLGLLLYLGYRFFKKRREQRLAATSYYSGSSPQVEGWSGTAQPDGAYGYGQAQPAYGELDRGIDQIRSFDRSFDEERFKETVQDLFFRIQAGWTNRSLDGIEPILTDEMVSFFRQEFDTLKQRGVINRLENIAVRKVEPTEAWQETGKEFITVLITANLLDYVVDANTREVVEGDKMNPVKFQEFWTFCRDIGSQGWKLSAINQVDR